MKGNAKVDTIRRDMAHWIWEEWVTGRSKTKYLCNIVKTFYIVEVQLNTVLFILVFIHCPHPHSCLLIVLLLIVDYLCHLHHSSYDCARIHHLFRRLRLHHCPSLDCCVCFWRCRPHFSRNHPIYSKCTPAVVVLVFIPIVMLLVVNTLALHPFRLQHRVNYKYSSVTILIISPCFPHVLHSSSVVCIVAFTIVFIIFVVILVSSVIFFSGVFCLVCPHQSSSYYPLSSSLVFIVVITISIWRSHYLWCSHFVIICPLSSLYSPSSLTFSSPLSSLNLLLFIVHIFTQPLFSLGLRQMSSTVKGVFNFNYHRFSDLAIARITLVDNINDSALESFIKAGHCFSVQISFQIISNDNTS